MISRAIQPYQVRSHRRIALIGTVAALAVIAGALIHSARAGQRDTTSRDCLTSDTLSVLEGAETHFNVKFDLASTCRPGAIIEGTNHASEHASGRAVDVKVPRSVKKRDLVKWFFDHARGVTMTYRYMAHVHFDTGAFHKIAFGSGTRPKRHRVASAP